MTNGGFQNHIHFLYGLPGGILTRRDTSDILDVDRKRRKREEQRLEEIVAAQLLQEQLDQKREEQLLEEIVAAQLLQEQLEQVELAPEVEEETLRKVLQAKLYQEPKLGEVVGIDRQKRITLLLMLLELDDE